MVVLELLNCVRISPLNSKAFASAVSRSDSKFFATPIPVPLQVYIPSVMFCDKKVGVRLEDVTIVKVDSADPGTKIRERSWVGYPVSLALLCVAASKVGADPQPGRVSRCTAPLSILFMFRTLLQKVYYSTWIG